MNDSGKRSGGLRPVGEFDACACELQGMQLIEASAGTGKTWNICVLYLRLLLEQGLEVRQILVVTFTQAAASELRERVRTRIAEALGAIRSMNAGEVPTDSTVAQLVLQAGKRRGESPEQLALALEKALESFDEAAISTIHGFCQRALGDVAFSAAQPLATEHLADEGNIRLEVVQDFWRRHVASASCPATLARSLHFMGDTPETYQRILKRHLGKPLAHVVWPDADRAESISDASAGLEKAESALCDSFRRAQSIWSEDRGAIVEAVLRARSALNGNIYRQARVEAAADAWDRCFVEALPPWPRGEEQLRPLFSAGFLAKSNKRGKLPEHPFFAAAEDLLEKEALVIGQVHRLRYHFMRAMLAEAGEDLRKRKREQRLVSFDDMLFLLYEALHQGDALRLAAKLRKQYRAALVDEFQDTDPLQLAIFTKLYSGHEAPCFFVGDPKQAIYRFRNADLHTYLKAREQVRSVHTLATNQRSSPGLITSVNALFGASSPTFLLEKLAFRSAVPGERRREPFEDRSMSCASSQAALQVWRLPSVTGGQALTKARAAALSADACAAEIARLLRDSREGKITVGGRPLRARDIAVLVPKRSQGSRMKRALGLLNIACVELERLSLFHTVDAEELERILHAIQSPARESLLRAALATELFASDAEAILHLSVDERSQLAWADKFAGYLKIWVDEGVGIMLRRLLRDEGLSGRILARPAGERRLSHLLHLAEVLQQASATHATPEALLRWLGSKRRESADDEANLVRLESDRDLVQIMTIHKSKGLEFPVVFCPFLWDGKIRTVESRLEGRQYHDAEGVAVIDYTPHDKENPRHRDIEDRIRFEAASEGLRLIYVALTRAVYRCYLVVGTYLLHAKHRRCRESETSMLNWLVAGRGCSPQQWFDAPRDSTVIAAAWASLALHSAPHLSLEPLPGQVAVPLPSIEVSPETLAARDPPPRLKLSWQTTSFSGMTRSVAHEGAEKDHDLLLEESASGLASGQDDNDQTEGPALSNFSPGDILAFPRGQSAGTCLHAVLEHADFTNPSAWRQVVVQALLEHPPSEDPQKRQPAMAWLQAPGDHAQERLRERGDDWIGMVEQMLSDLVQTPLPEGILLSQLSAAQRLNELGFCFPASRVSAHQVQDTLRSLHYPVPPLAFGEIEGFLRGSIDMVFVHRERYYLIDWKSNHLGYSAADYALVRLEEAMEKNRYYLQLLLYALALRRYLQYRIPGYSDAKHFGGVYYLFIRGVRPSWSQPEGAPAGVLFHRPSEEALTRLDQLFAGTSKPLAAFHAS